MVALQICIVASRVACCESVRVCVCVTCSSIDTPKEDDGVHGFCFWLNAFTVSVFG